MQWNKMRLGSIGLLLFADSSGKSHRPSPPANRTRKMRWNQVRTESIGLVADSTDKIHRQRTGHAMRWRIGCAVGEYDDYASMFNVKELSESVDDWLIAPWTVWRCVAFLQITPERAPTRKVH